MLMSVVDNFDRQSSFANLDKTDFSYLQMIPPVWMLDDPLYEQLAQLPHLYLEGRVVWGCVVQANAALWSEDNSSSCPAELLFDPTGKADVDTLKAVAKQLYALKDTTPTDPDLLAYAEHITDENTNLMNHDVPDVISPLPLKTTSMFIWRLHLPNGVLQKVLPILVSDKTPHVTVLPAKFWDKPLYDDWMDAHHFKADMYHGVRQLYKGSNPWKNASNILKPKLNELQDLARFKDASNLASSLTGNKFSHLDGLLDGLPSNTQENAVEVKNKAAGNGSNNNYRLTDKGFVEESIQTAIDEISEKIPHAVHGKNTKKAKPWWVLWLIMGFVAFKLWFIISQIL